MNYGMTDDQQSVLGGLDQLISATGAPAPQHAATHTWSPELERALGESGFIDIAREEGFGPLDAALIVERMAREPQVVEIGASALIGPLLPIEPGTRPIALLSGDGSGAARYLPMARLLIVDRADEMVLIEVAAADVEPVPSLLAYPYGRLRDGDRRPELRIQDPAAVRRRWRIAVAAEAAGCMAAALQLVIDHVTARYAFGRPLGSFQAIQHRLAMAAETAESASWLARRAAWSDADGDAAIAAGFVQGRIAQFTYDLHQFVGAMGLTLEFPLHLWTYRLRALVSDLGGASAQARAVAQLRWGTPA